MIQDVSSEARMRVINPTTSAVSLSPLSHTVSKCVIGIRTIVKAPGGSSRCETRASSHNGAQETGNPGNGEAA